MTHAPSGTPATTTPPRTGVVVAVVGAGEATDTERDTARRVGAYLGRHGATVLTGGLGGVMAAACQGAWQAGGHTLGLLPGTDRSQANPWVEVAVPTGLGEARNVLVVRAAHAVVAVGGEYGTLSEIALALKAGTPVVGISTWRLLRHGVEDNGIEVVDNPEQAASSALRRAGAPTDTVPRHPPQGVG